MKSNPESFVIDAINRLEHDWRNQDEIVEWQLAQGRNTGEYYDQTGKEPHGAVGANYCISTFIHNIIVDINSSMI